MIGLLHGAWHTGASWQYLQEALSVRGLGSRAVTLPSDVPGLGVEAYAQTAADEWADVDEPMVIVAHSLGGLTAGVLAGKREVSMIIYLAALLPSPGLSLAEQREGVPMMTEKWRNVYLPQQQREDNGNTWWPATLAPEIFYHDCTAKRAAEAVAELRQQAAAPIVEKTPLRELPELPVAYILAQEDRVVDPEWSRQVALERLGVRARELPGGHSPFLSRPDLLAEEIVDAVHHADINLERK